MTKKPINDNEQALIQRFLDSLWMEHGLSDQTLTSYGSDLNQLSKWLSEKNISSLLKCQREHILA